MCTKNNKKVALCRIKNPYYCFVVRTCLTFQHKLTIHIYTTVYKHSQFMCKTAIKLHKGHLSLRNINHLDIITYPTKFECNATSSL